MDSHSSVIATGNAAPDVTITGVHAHGIRSPRIVESLNVLRDEAVIVEVETDAGVSGWSEINGLIPALKALVEADQPHPRDRGPRHALVGKSLRDLDGLVRDLRANSIISGRAGLGRVAIAGVETALFDLFGKLTNSPAWQLLPGASTEPAQTTIRPYITIYNRGSYDDVVAKGKADIDRAMDYGYRSFKLEATDYNTSPSEALDLVEQIRDHVGDDIELSIDNVYRWPDYASGLRAAQKYKELGATFLEDPFLPEQWDMLRRLSDEVGLPLATGGGMQSLSLFIGQMDIAGTAIVQPGVHVNGLLGSHEVAQQAVKRDRRVTSFGVAATSLTAAGQLHLAAANSVIDYVEYAPYELFPNLLLRADVAGPEPKLSDGMFDVPTSSGIGADCDRDALAQYRVEY